MLNFGHYFHTHLEAVYSMVFQQIIIIIASLLINLQLVNYSLNEFSTHLNSENVNSKNTNIVKHKFCWFSNNK